MPSLPSSIANAAYQGELQQVVKWLQQGGHVDAIDGNGNALLQAAAAGGQLRVAKELLQRGASIDLRGINGATALMVAAGQGHNAVVRLLLEHKAGIDLQDTDGATALMLAASEVHQECVQELLQAGASTELRDHEGGRTALGYADDAGHAAIAELLRQHAATPPTTAAAPTPNLSGRRVRISGLKARPELNGRCGVAGRYNAVKDRYEVAVEGEAEAVLLKPASLQDVEEASAASRPAPVPPHIGRAAAQGDLQQVVEWLQQGGHVNALDEIGNGLLHVAAGRGQLRVAKELLQRGASIDLRGTRGTTPLILAAGMGQYSTVCLLLEHKAEVDLQADGMTALMLAACEGSQECVQELLQAGSSTELREHDFGRTALGHAEAKGHADIAELLRQHAAKPPATIVAPMPSLSGRRVRIGGLQARPELNGLCGVAGRFDEVKGRYAVAVEGEAEAVLLKPASLQDMGELAAPSVVPSSCPPEEQVPTARDVTLCEPALAPAPRDSGRHPVWVAAQSGNLQQVVEWLQAGEHVDAVDENGNGLLHSAARGGQLRVAKELLQRSASIDLCGSHDIASLMIAAGLGHDAMVRLLLEHKAGIDLQNAVEASALMLAAGQGHKECVQELLEAGASTELSTQYGMTALSVAKGHPATAKLLRQHAARPRAASPKTAVTAEARAAAEAAADRAATELLAEEGAKDGSKTEVGKGKKNKKEKGRGAAPTAPANVLPFAAEPAAAAPTPSACELATAALQQAIDAGELEPIRKAIGTHATAADSTDVLKEARTLRDRLAEQQRKAAKEAKLAGKRDQKRREGGQQVVAEAEAAVVAAVERTEAELRAAAAENKRVAAELATAERAAAERAEEDAHLDEALARSMASLQADEERRRASAASAAPPPPIAATAETEPAVELTLEDLVAATNGFAEDKKIGSGGFGRVYLAAADKLPLSSLPANLRHLPLAVKRAKSDHSGGLLRKLKGEVKMLKDLYHPHLLPLLGYCLSEAAPCLISPLMRGGSLKIRLRSTEADPEQLRLLGLTSSLEPLTWTQRVRSEALLVHSRVPHPVTTTHRFSHLRVPAGEDHGPGTGGAAVPALTLDLAPRLQARQYLPRREPGRVSRRHGPRQGRCARREW